MQEQCWGSLLKKVIYYKLHITLQDYSLKKVISYITRYILASHSCCFMVPKQQALCVCAVSVSALLSLR